MGCEFHKFVERVLFHKANDSVLFLKLAGIIEVSGSEPEAGRVGTSSLGHR